MIQDLPLLLDAEEAIKHLNENECNDAVKAYAIGIMSRDGYSNARIRKAIGIKAVYTATHYIRAGTKLTEDELQAWNENIQKIAGNVPGVYPITLGHIRVIAKYKIDFRKALLAKIDRGLGDGEIRLKRKPISIPLLKKLITDTVPSNTNDIRTLEEMMEEQLGRGVTIQFNPSSQSGFLKLKYFSLEDLDVLIERLGIKRDENY